MSSLTVALAILGGLVLAVVIGYNAWMSRRNAPRQPDAPDGERPETASAPLSRDEEPVLHVTGHPVAGAERHEPLFDPDLPAPSALPIPTADRRGGLDPLIDVIAPITLDGLAS